MEKIAVLAITKNGIQIGLKLREFFPTWEIFAPMKFQDDSLNITWFSEPTVEKIGTLFKTSDGLVCLFSLGAVIRLIAPHMKDKKTDPAVIVIDDQMNFVISVLSGHLGGANQLANDIAQRINSTPVITTAADVNKTIAVDLIGRNFGWKIDKDTNVTKISAFMVNGEAIGVYQDAGEKNWWQKQLPKNVTVYQTLQELENSNSKGKLIISDKKLMPITDTVIFRPQTLVVGIGLHWDTTSEVIINGLKMCLEKFNLAEKSICKFVSIKKQIDVKGLVDAAKTMNVSLEYVDKEQLAQTNTPNPSEIVQSFEGTPSVSEAAAIKVSKGKLIVEKQKFPPNLTIAIARISK